MNQKVFNIQPIEKRITDPRINGLDVHSIFLTIQGEGPFSGRPAIFIRLAGCNLQCPLCDTDYTQGREGMAISSIYLKVKELTPSNFNPLVVITGGEPFRQYNLSVLTRYLIDAGYHVQIETNGTIWNEHMPLGPRLTIVCSPKAGKVADGIADYANAFKYVLTTGDVDPSDGLPIHALAHPVGGRVARPPVHLPKGSIYVQPVDTQDEAENKVHLQTAIESAMEFGYVLCIQTHKIINVP